MGADGWASVARVTLSAVARQRRDGAIRRHLAHHIIAVIRNVQIAGSIHHRVGGQGEFGAGGRPPVAAIAYPTTAGHRGDDAIRGDFADLLTVTIRDIEVTRSIEPDALRGIELGVGRQAPVARVALAASTDHGRNDAVGRHCADHVVVFVRDMEVAG